MTLIIVIIIVTILFVVMTYNGMIKLRNRVKEGWADIDVQLKRRYNLIPNLVESVKGYAAHEEGVFTKVTEARSNAINATNMKDQGAAENMLSGALKSLFAVAENYPDLKANENFIQLQNELVDTEDKIQAARRFYNGVVRDFNTKIQQMPNNLIANAFKFTAEEFFEIEDEEQRENVEVSFKKEAPVVTKPEPQQANPATNPQSKVEPAAKEAPAESEQTPTTPEVAPIKTPSAELIKSKDSEPTPEVPEVMEKEEVKDKEPAPENPAKEAPAESEQTPEPQPIKNENDNSHTDEKTTE